MIKNSTVSLLLPLVVVHVDVVVIALAIGCSCVFYCCCDRLLLLLLSLSVAMENVRSLGEVWWSAHSRQPNLRVAATEPSSSPKGES